MKTQAAGGEFTNNRFYDTLLWHGSSRRLKAYPCIDSAIGSDDELPHTEEKKKEEK